MQFVFSSLDQPREPLPPRGGGGDADAAAARDAALFGGSERLVAGARRVLDSVTLPQVLATRPRRPVVALDTHMRVADALALLAATRVLGAPLFDIQKRRFVTFVDVAGLLRAFLEGATSRIQLCGSLC